MFLRPSRRLQALFGERCNNGPAGSYSFLAHSPRDALGEQGIPKKRLPLVVWLASDPCSFSTGLVFDISGGEGHH